MRDFLGMLRAFVVRYSEQFLRAVSHSIMHASSRYRCQTTALMSLTSPTTLMTPRTPRLRPPRKTVVARYMPHIQSHDAAPVWLNIR